MKILVTGCTGFVGSNLISLLLKEGHHISCISRRSNCPNSNRTNHLSYDLRKHLDYSMLPTELDCIIHLAATMEKSVGHSDMFLINVLSTLNLLEYGEKVGVKKFIFISSGAVYGYSKKLLSEESPISPIDFYGLSKYQSELLVNYYAPRSSTVILRLSFPYGPGQVRGIIPMIARRIKNKDAIIIYNDGNPKIKPTYITHVINSINKSLRLEGQHVFNVCGDEEITIKELSLLIANYLGLEPIFAYVNDERVTDLIYDNSLLKEYLGSTPMVSLKQGIKNYLRNFDSLNGH